MSVQLYKPGDRVLINGVRCEVGRFPNPLLDAKLAEGWKLRPEETIDPGVLSDTDIRNLARIKGVPRWNATKTEKLREILTHDGVEI